MSESNVIYGFPYNSFPKDTPEVFKNLINQQSTVVSNTSTGIKEASLSIENIQSETKSLQRNVVEITNTYNNISLQIGALNRITDGLNSDVVSIKNDINNIESSIVIVNNNISALQSGLTQAQLDITTLQSGLTQAQTDITTLDTNKVGFTDYATSSKSGVVDLAAKITALSNISLTAAGATYDQLAQQTNLDVISSTINDIINKQSAIIAGQIAAKQMSNI